MPPKSRPERVKFEYIRSPFYRVVHSNGAWGGLTPRQELSVAFYSERTSPPRHITHQLTRQGQLGPEVSRDKPNTIQREFEVEVLMSMEEAVNLHQWIGNKIEEWRKVGLSIPKDNLPETS